MSNFPIEAFYCDLNLIHKIITRGIQVSLENAEEYRAAGFPDERVKIGKLVDFGNIKIEKGADRIKFAPFVIIV